MNRCVIRQALLGICLLAAAPLVLADNHHMMDHHDGDRGMHHDGGGRFGPVKRAEKHLSELEQKLNLKSDQMAAWKTYSQAVMGHAKDRETRMKKFRGRRGSMHSDADTATKLERASQWMRAGADRLEQMAKDTRTFQTVLTTEQQTIFDLYWQVHSPRNRWERHHRRW
ncbi:MAG: Spy/CpxP family protein refolding chaperone [Betaproteobacteria bacterium]|nr:MAG: Spy/CpxP family protein refolding chaperone [Betaproteobacteria bacterium]